MALPVRFKIVANGIERIKIHHEFVPCVHNDFTPDYYKMEYWIADGPEFNHVIGDSPGAVLIHI
jgi:hypothetical protein